MNQAKSLMLLALILPAQLALGHIFRGPHKQPITAEMYGPAANAQIKDLDALTIQYFNNICQQHGR